MLQRLIERMSYANVIATIALFVALGGTSYAALKLPRNSVGATQIKAGAVGSSELHNRSVRLSDLSVSARASLKGPKDLRVRRPAGSAPLRSSTSRPCPPQARSSEVTPRAAAAQPTPVRTKWASPSP